MCVRDSRSFSVGSKVLLKMTVVVNLQCVRV